MPRTVIANGNYDVFATKISGGKVDGGEMEVATSLLFQARATIAVDQNNRVWVAWEEGRVNWGKDQGYTIRDVQAGAPERIHQAQPLSPARLALRIVVTGNIT